MLAVGDSLGALESLANDSHHPLRRFNIQTVQDIRQEKPSSDLAMNWCAFVHR